MGYAVTELGANDLTADKLHDLDAIVIGIRVSISGPIWQHIYRIFSRTSKLEAR